MSQKKNADGNVHTNESMNSYPSEPRVGVYVCQCGGNISDVVDVERMAAIAHLIPGVVLAKVHTFMCSDPGQQSITEGIVSENLDRVVVASCTPFLHEETFRGAVSRGNLNPYLYEHVNIREQVSWAHKHDPKGATDKAIRLVAAAVGKLRYAQPLEQIRLPNHRKAVIVGGGIAGMKAAAELAARGIHVVLVESSNRLGGRLNERGAVYPTEAQASTLVDQLRAGVENNPLVEILLDSHLSTVKGSIGNFQITLEGSFGSPGQSTSVNLTAGAIVVATGFQPYVPRDGEFLYKSEAGVVTTPEFIQLLQGADPEARELVYQNRRIRSIAFLHCVGSRQLDGIHEPQADGSLNTYCSRVCCTTVLQQALAVRHRFPSINVFDLHQDIRTYGRGQEEYYINASKAGVVFFRYHGDEPPKVERTERPGARGAPLTVTVKDYLTWGEELRLPVDMVVLAVGIVPSDIRELVDTIKLSTGADHFLQEVHPKLRPVEVAVNGVLLAGTAQAPMSIQETLNAAGAAAAKVAAMFVKDVVELDPYIAEVDTTLCEGEGLCVTQCDYEGALRMIEEQMEGRTVRRAQVNAGSCVGCGACVGVCPHSAINLNGWRVDQYEAMVDGLVADLPVPVGQS